MKSHPGQKSLSVNLQTCRGFAVNLILIFLFGFLVSSDTGRQRANDQGVSRTQPSGQLRRQVPVRKKTQVSHPRISNEPVVQAELRPSKDFDSSSSMTRIGKDYPDEIVAHSKKIKRQPPIDGPGRGGNSSNNREGSEFSAPPATTFDPVLQTMMELGNDPQIAVGEHFIVGTEAHHVAFYNRKGELLKEKVNSDGAKLPTQMSAWTLFKPVHDPFLPLPAGQLGPARPNPDDINRHLGPQSGYDFMICNPDTALGAIALGCINEAYDTRVIYDRERRRFWIVSALRDQIWGSSSSICDTEACAPQESRLPRRFVAVAVTKTEDPRDGFNEFVLVDDYADWPRVAIHGPFLIISHNSNNNVFLFDAQKLADGNPKHELVGQGTFYDADFTPTQQDHVYPVVQHDKRDGTDSHQDPFIPTLPPTPGGSKKVPTFIVGVKGNKVSVFNFDTALIDPIAATIMHPKLARASIDLHDDAPHITANPVYRNGFIYLVGDHCVDGKYPSCNQEIRLIKIPVFRGPDFLGSIVYASANPSMGFRDITFGGGSEDKVNSLAGPSFEIPAVDVNKNDDVVIVYARAGYAYNLFLDAPGAFYHLVRKSGESDGILHQAICGPSAVDKFNCAQRQPGQNAIDVGGIVVDPLDDTTVWMAHAIADGTMKATKKYRMVIGHVKP